MRPGSFLVKQDFIDINKSLQLDGQKPMTATPSNPFWMPAPHEVGRALYTAFTTAPVNKGDPWLHESLGHSLKMIFFGFGIAAILGVPIGLLCGTFDFISKLTEPFVDFIRYMPAPAFAMLLLGIFGISDQPKVALIVIATFFPMVLVVANTTRNLDPALLEAAQTLGADRKRMLGRVVLPGVMANLYTDLRIMIGASWTALMIAELIGEATGLSLFISRQARYFRYDNVYAAIILIGLVGLITDQTLQFLGAFLFPWQAKPANSVSRSVIAAITFVPRKMIGLVRRPRSTSSERASDVSVA
jgi:NitT/TauT family transport system permease protein